MTLKYQSDIDDFALPFTCPKNPIAIAELKAYRFCFSPIDHKLNFLPNVPFDRERNYSYPYKNDSQRCNRCGSSFYSEQRLALNGWNSIGEEIRQNLGYTHLAEGILDKEDGVMNSIDKYGHFTFYESDVADLISKFTLLKDPL